MLCSVMINVVKRQRFSQIVTGAGPEEELPSSVIEIEVEERAATGPSYPLSSQQTASRRSSA